MLKFSKKTDYAIILLVHLSGSNGPVSAREVARCYSLPYPMVSNILKDLVNSCLIKSTRGHSGGYILARSENKINLAEIIEITDGPFNLVECCNGKGTCNIHYQCPTRRTLTILHEKIQNFFEDITLSSIVGNLNSQNKLRNSDYEITNLLRL